MKSAHPNGLALSNSFSLSIKSHINRHVMPRDLPWVKARRQPRIRGLELRAVGCDELLENAVLVPKTIPPNWKFHSRAGIEVARSQAAEAAISKTGVALVVEEIFKIEAEFVGAFFVDVTDSKVE